MQATANQQVFTEAEAAEFLRMTPRQLADERRDGRIKFSRVRRNGIRYSRAQLDQYLAERETVMQPDSN